MRMSGAFRDFRNVNLNYCTPLFTVSSFQAFFVVVVVSRDWSRFALPTKPPPLCLYFSVTYLGFAFTLMRGNNVAKYDPFKVVQYKHSPTIVCPNNLMSAGRQETVSRSVLLGDRNVVSDKQLSTCHLSPSSSTFCSHVASITNG